MRYCAPAGRLDESRRQGGIVRRRAILSKLIVVGLFVLLGTSCALSEMATITARTRIVGHHISRMSLYEGDLYFGAGYCLYRLRPQGRVLEQILCTQDWIFQRPAINGHRGYAQVVTSPEGRQFFVAIDLSTGTAAWRVDESENGPYLGWMKDNVVLVDDRVITAQGDRFSSEQRICAFDVRTGRRVWRTSRSHMERADPWLLHDDLIWYVIDKEGTTTRDGTLVAVDVVMGRIRERLDLRSEFMFDQLLHIDEDKVFGVGTSSASVRYVVAVDRAASQVIWAKPLTFPGNVSQATLYDGLLAYEGNGLVYALDQATGQTVWQYDPSIGQATTDSPGHIVLYVLGAMVDGDWVYGLHALDSASGGMVWSYFVYDYTEPIVLDNTVYVGNRYSIDALDLRTGHVLWQVDVDSRYEYDFSPL